MNNKGFAITTILYGTLILFLMLLLSLLGILTSYKDKLSILIDRTGAARDIINSARFLYVEHIKNEEPEEETYECYYYNGTHVDIVYDDEDLECQNNCIPTLVNGVTVYPDSCEADYITGHDIESCTVSGYEGHLAISGVVCTQE